MLSQHSVVSIGIVADVCVIIVIGILIGFGETTYVCMGVGTHVDMTVTAEMTTIVTALLTTVSANTVIEVSGGAATSGTFGAKDGGKSVGARRGNLGDVRTRMGGDTFV